MGLAYGDVAGADRDERCSGGSLRVTVAALVRLPCAGSADEHSPLTLDRKFTPENTSEQLN